MPFYDVFGNDWIGFAFYFVAILALVFVSGILLEKFKVSGQITRQFVHAGVGLLVLTSPFTIHSPLQPSLLAGIFIVLNLVNILKGGMKGIHSTERFSLGTVFFPLSFLILILLYWDKAYILIVGMAIMTISDPLASILGTRLSRDKFFVPWKDKKSVTGLFTIFISATVIVLVITTWIKPDFSLTRLIILSVTVGIVATAAESISFAGSDNLSLPLLSALMYDIGLETSNEGLLAILGWIFLSLLLALGSYRLKALDISGAFGAMLLGAIVFSIGGIRWALPMLTFYILSSILSKIGGKKKQKAKGIIEKGSRRDIYQVFANGGVAFLAAIFYWYTKSNLAYVVFLGSLAAATADTWATEIGLLSGIRPVSILNFRHVLPGTSGGITPVGTAGAIAGAFILSLGGLPGSGNKLIIAEAALLGGFLGAMVDSLAGATIQAQYKCTKCNKITEKKIHCGIRSKHISGVHWINNDVVNLICTLSGGVFALGLSLLS